MSSSSLSSSSTTTTTTSTTAIPTAVVINKSKNENVNNNVNNNIPTIEATAIYSEPIIPIHGQELRQDIGICRSCGKSFQRPIGTHDAMAQFYRCKECCKLKITDFCIIS
jgi:hypothetical protein